jgi:hypothetical protein
MSSYSIRHLVEQEGGTRTKTRTGGKVDQGDGCDAQGVRVGVGVLRHGGHSLRLAKTVLSYALELSACETP